MSYVHKAAPNNSEMKSPLCFYNHCSLIALQAALGCPDFAPFVRDVPDHSGRLRKSVGAPLHQCQTPRHWLLAVHLTCIYIAAKNVEVVPYVHLLQTMLQCLHGLIVTQDQAEALELEVLLALEWRLGPFFLHQKD